MLDDDDRDELLETHRPMCLRQRAQLYDSYDAYRRGKDRSLREVSIGRFVGWRVTYEATVAANDQQPFWVGKVVGVDDEENTVKVHYYHSPCKRNGNWSRAVFRPWTGPDKIMTVPFDTIIDVFDHLNPNAGTLPAPSRRFMLNAVTRGELPRGDESDFGNSPLNAESSSRSPVTRKRKKRKREDGKGKTKGKRRGNGKEKGHGKGSGQRKGKGKQAKGKKSKQAKGKKSKQSKRKRLTAVTGENVNTRISSRSTRSATRSNSSSSSSSSRSR